MKKTVSWMLALLLFACAGAVPAGGAANLVYVRAQEESEPEKKEEAADEQAVDEHAADEQAGGVQITTPHAAVAEVSTGTVLYEKDADVRVHPASVTKVMTALLIFEALHKGEISLSDEVTTSAYAKSMGGSQVFLEEGEVQTVETLLKCILIASGNDAAVAMAEYLGGTEEAFVGQMNEKAQSLGMENTHFEDCCGLTDSSGHYTSARDVAILSCELLNLYPEVTEYTDIWMEDITHVTAKGSSAFTLTNTNKLLRAFDGCDGLKTGSTSFAGYCLSATAKRNGIRLVSVVMTSPDSKTRFAEAAQLLNYGFSRCTLYQDEDIPVLPDVKVKGSIQEGFTVRQEGAFSYLSTDGEDFSAIQKELEWEEDIRAPLEKGDPVGYYVYRLGEKEIGRIPVVMAEDAQRSGYLDYLGSAWEKWRL